MFACFIHRATLTGSNEKLGDNEPKLEEQIVVNGEEPSMEIMTSHVTERSPFATTFFALLGP